ncbi:Cu2+-exporting ATPase [Allopseudospirillum japonicum]|uniref:Cu2+-exporting ATPase n=1 Tax=Allopseudospirillum japonicum TaxID=64971 RepID=A0A1H6TFH1_9GAMM|nr:heavy metal translocating P-type ATPase [Allopseudospirillum japonicum]SEI78833.1 Cu2+-exporting ATPase [Allopseudospirillum japonicum]
MEKCYHCGEPVPADSPYFIELDQTRHPMCCPGCEAVAHAIVEGGLASYYKYRTQMPLRPEEDHPHLEQEMRIYDRPELQAEFVHHDEQGLAHIQLAIEGITCAACAWLIEHQLSQETGVHKIAVNLSQHRASLTWDPKKTQLSQVLICLQSIGYQACPYQADQQQAQLLQQEKMFTRRLIIAGIGMMQVMMFAVGLYAEAFQGIEEDFKNLFRWLSLVMTTPVVLFSAYPFFKAAWRDLRTRHLSMDVPVALAIGTAYLASVWATLTDTGEVYFDSVSMFTFFLLFGRYIEMRARHRIGRSGNALQNLLPTSAIRLTADGQEEIVPTRDLQVGDRVLVKPGQSVPADGRIVKGRSSLNEAALTGEYMPVARTLGDPLMAGTQNVESPLEMQVEHTGQDARVASIARLTDRAFAEKPKVAALANRIAHWFVLAVLIIASSVAYVWWQLAPSDAFWITLSVLVVTCPCALSLATPTALTVAMNHLRNRGFLVTRSHVLEGLAQSTHIIFDKTGTLTQGQLKLVHHTWIADPKDPRCDSVLALAAALESHSEHPIARAFSEYRQIDMRAQSTQVVMGEGLTGEVQGQIYRLGKAEFAWPQQALQAPQHQPPTLTGQSILLADQQGPLCWFHLDDQLRHDALACIQSLQDMGLEVELLSGDQGPAVSQVAQKLGISTYTAAASPETKLARLRELQAAGEAVIMVGDGINDVPVLAGAQVSIAMGNATDLAKTSADALLVSAHLTRISDAIRLAYKTRRVIRQNLMWALVYNVLALPLAAMGMIPPWLAAIGMSVSSLIVVFNALRLSADKEADPLSPASFTAGAL